jgi:GntR family transcriptional regulator
MSLPDRSDLIDRSKLAYVWQQMADGIRADITAGMFAAGHRLPSEVELAGQYGVARMTARRAIAALVDDGVLVVLRGRGTYVTDSSADR